jgi:hypothetical protein
LQFKSEVFIAQASIDVCKQQQTFRREFLEKISFIVVEQQEKEKKKKQKKNVKVFFDQ